MMKVTSAFYRTVLQWLITLAVALVTVPGWYVLITWMPPFLGGFRSGDFWGIEFTALDKLLALFLSTPMTVLFFAKVVRPETRYALVASSFCLPHLAGTLFLWVFLCMQLDWNNLPSSAFDIFVGTTMFGQTVILLSWYFSVPISLLTLYANRYLSLWASDAWDRADRGG